MALLEQETALRSTPPHCRLHGQCGNHHKYSYTVLCLSSVIVFFLSAPIAILTVFAHPVTVWR